MENDPNDQAKAPPECRIARSSLVSDTGLVADASQHPFAQFCSGCSLIGANLHITYGGGGRGVEAYASNPRAAAHCVLKRFQRYDDPWGHVLGDLNAATNTRSKPWSA